MEKSGNGFGKYEAEKRKSGVDERKSGAEKRKSSVEMRKSGVNTRKGRAEIGKSRVDKGNGADTRKSGVNMGKNGANTRKSGVDTGKNEVEMIKNRADAGNSGTDKKNWRTGIGSLGADKKRGADKWENGTDKRKGRAGSSKSGAGESDFSQKQVKEAFRGKNSKDFSGRDRFGNKRADGKNEESVKNTGNGSRKRNSPCPVYEQCGGCQLLDMPYEKQLKIKQTKLEELLKPYCKVQPIIGMKDPFHYRNKVHAVFDHDKKGNPVSGVYEANTHRVVPVESCLIEDQKADEIIGTIRGMLKSFKIKTYDEDTGYGLLRHVLIRRGFTTGEIMVVLVTASPVFPSKNNFVRALREKHPEITTIVQNINNRSTSMVLGDKEHVLYGRGYIEDVLCGLRFRISSKSFYQVNSAQTELLYNKALQLAGLTGKEKVLDAYCGIGTIGLIASRKAGEVIGVELNPDAVRDAVQNAKMNDVKNIQFYCNDAGRFIVNMAEKGEKVDVILMDPPRSGSTKEFIDTVAKMGPERVVYVSCGPETLVRDLRWFMGNGYRAVEAWPVDMFGGTGHVETVVLLSKLKSAKSIEVKIELDEMDLTIAESKATYDKIKQYVLDKTGLKVSQLYIAQVKRKHGLIERINYNVGDGKAKVPQVPLEKEEAIEDALRHFKMI